MALDPNFKGSENFQKAKESLIRANDKNAAFKLIVDIAVMEAMVRGLPEEARKNDERLEGFVWEMNEMKKTAQEILGFEFEALAVPVPNFMAGGCDEECNGECDCGESKPARESEGGPATPPSAWPFKG